MGEIDEEQDELIQEFLIESYENLDQLDRELVQLESDPKNTEILSGVFRTIHTIKGTAGFLAFSKLEALTHVAENLLSKLRDGELDLNEDRTSGLLRAVDGVREILGSVEASGGEGDGDYTDLIEVLRGLLLEDVAASSEASATTSDSEPDAKPATEAVADDEIEAETRADSETVSSPPETTPAPATTDAPPIAAPAEQASGPAPPVAHAADSSIRVDVGLLDALMNLVGELVLTRNQILQHSGDAENPALHATTQRLNLITTELQEGVMKTRMQPIGKVWSKFPRVVRDLSHSCGKRVKVEMEGKETELDKTILEAIKDPLTHMIRNSVDHGLESPEERVAAGKPEEGTVKLRAFHEGGKVNIEIRDDGRGIDSEAIRDKALERGVITPEQANRMGVRELSNLIFLPGFSTAKKVTNVSGRGVGLDVVKTNIERIGGTVDIEGTPGQGTSVKVRIPLTLAIIPALVVSSGGERFAIPQVSLVELVLLEGERARECVEMIHGAPVYRLRGRLLPLAYLDRELGIRSPAQVESDGVGVIDDETETTGTNDEINIVVLHADGRQFGLIVDAVHDTEEIVVKPLGTQLKGIDAFAGATIMGDGQVALILDVLGLAQRANVLSEEIEAGVGDEASLGDESSSARRSLLIFELERERRMAVPLSIVARLEEVDPKTIERAGELDVTQYRGEIMPLVQLSQELGGVSEALAERDENLQVVVYTEAGRSVGLVVKNICDVIEEVIEVDECTRSHGIVGSVVLQEQVTDLVDVSGIVHETMSKLFGRSGAGEAGSVS